MEEFTQGRDMVRFMFPEIPLGFWLWNGLEGSILQENREGMRVGWKLEARQGSRVELVVVWDKAMAMGMQRRGGR